MDRYEVLLILPNVRGLDHKIRVRDGGNQFIVAKVLPSALKDNETRFQKIQGAALAENSLEIQPQPRNIQILEPPPLCSLKAHCCQMLIKNSIFH